jgi:aarF domain-containing kinase
MSGCAHCVYDIYADELMNFNEEIEKGKKMLKSLEVPVETWPEELRGETIDREVDSKRSGQEADEQVDALIEKIEDPTMKAFLKMERKLKQRQDVGTT